MKNKQYVANVKGIIIYFFAVNDLAAIKTIKLLGINNNKRCMLHEVQIDDAGKFVLGSQITLNTISSGNRNRNTNNKQPVQA